MILKLSDSLLAYKPIVGTGREAERNTVASLLPELFRDIARDSLKLCHREDGSPYIDDYKGYLSVSHGGETAIVVRNDITPVGVDIEAPRSQLLRVRHKFVGSGDFRQVNEEELDWLLRLWTAKEAVYKAALTSRLPLADISVVAPEMAVIPDGRKFRLTVYNLMTPNVITLAEKVASDK